MRFITFGLCWKFSFPLPPFWWMWHLNALYMHCWGPYTPCLMPLTLPTVFLCFPAQILLSSSLWLTQPDVSVSLLVQRRDVLAFLFCWNSWMGTKKSQRERGVGERGGALRGAGRIGSPAGLPGCFPSFAKDEKIGSLSFQGCVSQWWGSSSPIVTSLLWPKGKSCRVSCVPDASCSFWTKVTFSASVTRKNDKYCMTEGFAAFLRQQLSQHC